MASPEKSGSRAEIDTGERMEWMNDSRRRSGKRIFTEGQVVEARTGKRACRLQSERFQNPGALLRAVKGDIFLRKMPLGSGGSGTQQFWNRCRRGEKREYA